MDKIFVLIDEIIVDLRLLMDQVNDVGLSHAHAHIATM